MNAAHAIDFEETVRAEKARIAYMVHHAMLTDAVLPSDRNMVGSYWPGYLYEKDDYGAYEVNPNRINWKPTPRQIDEWETVMPWFGDAKPWQRALLLLRANQVVLTEKSSWQSIADALSCMPRMPSRGRDWCRSRHEELMESAWRRARREGIASV